MRDSPQEWVPGKTDMNVLGFQGLSNSVEAPGPSPGSNSSRVPRQRPLSHVSDEGSGLRTWNQGQRLLRSMPS